MIFENFKRIAGAATLAVTLGLSGAAHASTINTTSNVIFIVDESGSMSGEQAFLRNTVIDKLDADLATAGVTNRSYGVVGFGRSQPAPNNGLPRQIGSAGTLQDAAATKTNLEGLVASGGFEDGYEALAFALGQFAFTPGAAINFILVTDEDRDIRAGSTNTFDSMLNALKGRNILLNAVVNFGFRDGSGTRAIGINSSGEAYLADGSGGFTTSTGGVATTGAGTTKRDYIDLALQTGGAAWDLNLLRAGGLSAASFGSAFINIKVGEILSQPPSPGGPTSPETPTMIPLPAGAWLLLGGLGGLAALRRRKSA
jgi:hypothetical protein